MLSFCKYFYCVQSILQWHLFNVANSCTQHDVVRHTDLLMFLRKWFFSNTCFVIQNQNQLPRATSNKSKYPKYSLIAHKFVYFLCLFPFYEGIKRRCWNRSHFNGIFRLNFQFISISMAAAMMVLDLLHQVRIFSDEFGRKKMNDGYRNKSN